VPRLVVVPHVSSDDVTCYMDLALDAFFRNFASYEAGQPLPSRVDTKLDIEVGSGPEMARGIARNVTNYGDRDFSLYLRRSFAQSMGYSRRCWRSRWSASPRRRSASTTATAIARAGRGGEARRARRGRLPLDFPTVSLGEVFLHPTSMMFRNLMSIDVEEMIRAQPMDAVVLIGGCDKTVPAQLMGAVSADVPAIALRPGR
jgi:dihydroxy-acid dehydratase